MSGGVLLSHRVAPAVPSALRVLASGFGMCPGVSLALWPPKLSYQPRPGPRVCGVGVGGFGAHRPTRRGGGVVSVWCCCVSVCWEPQSGRESISGSTPLPYNDGVDSDCQVIGVLVPVSCTPCGASTSGLSTQSSGWEPLPRRDGNLILRPASRLDAFSGYPSRT